MILSFIATPAGAANSQSRDTGKPVYVAEFYSESQAKDVGDVADSLRGFCQTNTLCRRANCLSESVSSPQAH